jgi:hypothetical protein
MRAFVLGVLALGCNGPAARVVQPAPPTAELATTGAPAPEPPPPAPTPPPPPPKLTADGPFVPLAVEGWADAVVAVPLGAESPRPIVIAAHGNYDRPEWQCQVWRAIVRERAFVLCPRGAARPDSPGADDIRFTYGSNALLEKEADAGLAALRARFGEWVAPGPVLWGGFSLGAIMGVAIAGRRPADFPRLALVEGGHDRWTAKSIAGYAKGGGSRVLFACGQKACVHASRSASAQLEKNGVATQIVSAPDQGHSYDGPVAEQVAGAFDWLVEGDARY